MSTVHSGDPSPSAAPATRILVADDDCDVRHVVSKKLERAGHIVRQVPDGGSALVSTRLWQPDLVLLDINMPGMSGLDVLRSIRRDPEVSATRVIMLTGQGTSTELATGMTAGADDYVIKPFSPSDLLARIATVLAS